MYFYLVWVSSPQFKSSEPLTYSYEGLIKNGSIVEVPFRNKTIIGLVEDQTTKPDFTTKNIARTIRQLVLPPKSLELFKWMMHYYPASSASHLQLFLPNNLLKINDRDITSSQTLKKVDNLKLPKLTEEQSTVIDKINGSTANSVLLHGNTGSGKTRIYSELIFNTLKEGKSCVVLTPEIGMTPQLLNVLEESFPGRITLLHSSLTEMTRRKRWLKIITNDQPQIVIGPRSALFSPVSNIGLIVMDEAHESSYKQEQSPYYQSTRVAAKLSEISKAKLILGTATPLISDYFVFLNKNLLTTRMIQPAIFQNNIDKKTVIKVVPLTDRSEFTKSVWLSDDLINSISKSLNSNEQSIVFLNRRGSAQIILCQNCGWQALCPNCDTSLTYHADSHEMVCHSCSFRKSIPNNCPICDSPNILFKGVGTKAIAEELKRLFSQAKISRFDRDNSKADSLEENYEDLFSGKIDIAVGTQLITKGLDLPKLSTVGIVTADSGLSFPDYMAEERTFQNISQVIGRVGRGHVPGRVIIQTYNSDSIALKSAINKDFTSFYDQQITERYKYNYPPYVFMLKVLAKRASQKSSQKACEDIELLIRSQKINVMINGPAPAFHEKQNGRFVWQLIIKSKSRNNLLKIIEILPANITYDIDPSGLL